MSDGTLPRSDDSASGDLVGTRVLIVDDEAVCSRFLAARLADEGCEIQTALAGTEALEIASGFAPDVLVIDWMLKDRYSGIEVARLLGDRNPHLRVIFFTGLSAHELETKARAAGLEGFRIFEKPCRIETLAQGVREAARSLAKAG